MRITFLSPPPNLSGGQRVIATHADGLIARGHQVTIVAHRHPIITWKNWVRALVRGRRPRRPAQRTHYDDMETPLHVVDHDGPFEDFDVPDADAVVATWWETAFEASMLSPSKGRRFYLVQHHETHWPMNRHLAAGSYHLPLRKIAISGWLKSILTETYGDHDAALVPNSVDLERFCAAARARQNIPTVGLMYSTMAFKGVDVALDAIARLRKMHPSLKVVAFGTEPVSPNLPLPPRTRYVLQPPHVTLREIYASCDVFVAASHSEGFGLPILEAMACRTPVVATRTGCAEDVIEEGVNGFLADVGDAQALALGMAQVLRRSEADWQRMSDAAHSRVSGYTWQDAAKLLEKVLEG